MDGVTIDLHEASDELVTLNVERDNAGITAAAKALATTFNDAIGRINDYDFFDTETEERGVLLGNRTTGRVRDALYRTLRNTRHRGRRTIPTARTGWLFGELRW